MEFCKFCGEELVNGNCPNNHTFKKMCLNCVHCFNDGGEYRCQNEENKKKALAKIMEAAQGAACGYQIDDLKCEISPLPIKKPNCKCGEWSLNEVILNEMSNLFV